MPSIERMHSRGHAPILIVGHSEFDKTAESGFARQESLIQPKRARGLEQWNLIPVVDERELRLWKRELASRLAITR